MGESFQIHWLGCRHAEDGYKHHWGYGTFEGRSFTFWRIKRTDVYTFKDATSYTGSTRALVDTRGVEALRAEKLAKGYAELTLTASRQRTIANEFLVAATLTGLHVSKRRTQGNFSP